MLPSACQTDHLSLHSKSLALIKLTLSQTSPGFTCLQLKTFENTVGKGEIARNEQFFPFPTVFSIRLALIKLTLSQTSPGFTCLQLKSFENTVGKGEIARNEQFLLFPQCFLSVWP